VKGAKKGAKYDTGIGRGDIFLRGTKRESKIALFLAMKGQVAFHCGFEIDCRETLNLFQRIY